MAYVAMMDTLVADLYVSFSTGPKTPVKLKRGQPVPIEFLDPMDIKKSLGFGALGRLVRAGIIKDISDEDVEKVAKELATKILPSEVEIVKAPTPATSAKHQLVEAMSAEELHQARQDRGMVQNVDLTEGAGQSVNVQSVSFERAVVTNAQGVISVMAAEARKTEPQDGVFNEKTGHVEKVGVNLENYEPKSDISAVKDYTGFENLNHYDRLLVIKSCSDKALLSTISEKSPVKQLVNNARKRLSEL